MAMVIVVLFCSLPQEYMACRHLPSSLDVLIIIFMFYWVNGRIALSKPLAFVTDENNRAVPKPIMSYYCLIEKLSHKTSW